MYTNIDTDILDYIENTAKLGRFTTLSWNRVTDSPTTKVTVNGVIARHAQHPESFVWTTKAGRPMILLRGKVVSSKMDERNTEGRPNTSDAGAEGKWKFYSVPLDTLRILHANGLVIPVKGNNIPAPISAPKVVKSFDPMDADAFIRAFDKMHGSDPYSGHF